MTPDSHCGMCADRRKGDPANRIVVGGVWVCLVCDVVGPALLYPSKIIEALRG